VTKDTETSKVLNSFNSVLTGKTGLQEAQVPEARGKVQGHSRLSLEGHRNQRRILRTGRKYMTLQNSRRRIWVTLNFPSSCLYSNQGCGLSVTIVSSVLLFINARNFICGLGTSHTWQTHTEKQNGPESLMIKIILQHAKCHLE